MYVSLTLSIQKLKKKKKKKGYRVMDQMSYELSICRIGLLGWRSMTGISYEVMLDEGPYDPISCSQGSKEWE